MNLTTAEAIMALYTDLIASIPREKLVAPIPSWRPGTPYSMGDITIEDQMICVEWSRYMGCGEHDSTTKHYSLSDFFEY